LDIIGIASGGGALSAYPRLLSITATGENANHLLFKVFARIVA